jgi:hypothetical protein
MCSAIRTHVFEADPSFGGLIGVGRCEMTPDAGIYSRNWGASRHETAVSIHRPLYATAVSFRESSQQPPYIVAAIDYCWFQSYQLLEMLRRQILSHLELDDEQFLLVVTHSHAVPHIDEELEKKPGGDKIAAYRSRVILALDEAVRAAVQTAVPAVLSWGRGHSCLARTRDFRDPSSGRILCGPNPLGSPDTTLVVGRITAEGTDRVLATLVNYACHPVSLGPHNRSVSPDYVGRMREVLESHTAGAPCVFLHGPSGNQTPRDSYSDDPAVADRNGEILGFAALSVLRALLPPARRLEFAREEASGADLAIWETRSYAVDRTLRSAVDHLRLPTRSWPTVEEVEARLRNETDPAAATRLERLRQYLTNVEMGLSGGFPIWGMRFGRAVLIGTPAEAFTDLQIALRAQFPDLAIIVTNDTNGSFNYLPPATYFGNGAYEQESTDFGVGALELIIAAAALLVQRLMDGDSAIS